MINKIKDEFRNKTVYILLAAAVLIACSYGIVLPPFHVHLLDGLTLIGLIYLLLGVIRWSWKAGDFTFFSYRPKHGSYVKWREGRIAEHKDAKNPFLPAGGIIIIAALILTLFY